MAYDSTEVVGHVAGALGNIVGAVMQGAAVARQRQLQSAADCREARARVRAAANAFNAAQLRARLTDALDDVEDLEERLLEMSALVAELRADREALAGALMQARRAR